MDGYGGEGGVVVVVGVVVGLEGGGSFGLKDDAVGCDGDC